MYTQKLNVQASPQLDAINASSAEVFNRCFKLKQVWDYMHGYFAPFAGCQAWMDKQFSDCDIPLHAHSIDAVLQRYFTNWKTYFALLRAGDKTARPPHKPKRYQTTTWKRSGIRFKGNQTLVLSLGRGCKPLTVSLPKSFDIEFAKANIAIINLVFSHGKYQLHFVYRTEKVIPTPAEGVMGVDIGEIHPIVCHDGQHTTIFNGRYIRSLYRLRNKVLASFGKKIDGCQRHSKRWWYLVRRKWQHLRKLDNQIRDCLHKHTTKFVSVCVERSIGTIVIGDLTGIREHINYGKRANQKLHQWTFGKITTLITQKAKNVGIKVEQIDEAYTSQTCPQCGNRKKPTTRNYVCECGYTYHRDGVGAINIRQKYLGRLGDPRSGGHGTARWFPFGNPTLLCLSRECSQEEQKKHTPLGVVSITYT